MSGAARPRNIVLITYDSLRTDHCSYMGYHRETTPTLDTMADTGVVFENAIAPASRTNPAMAGTFTGEPLVVRDRVAEPEHARSHLERHGTLAEHLRERGYATGAFCPNAYASRYYGFDRGFDRYEDFMFDNSLYQELFDKHLGDSSLLTMVRNLRNLVRRQEAFKTWDTYVDEIVDWATEQTEPFFLWTFSLDTHFPYLTPRKYRQWGSLVDMYYYNWRCNQLIDEFDIELSETQRQKITDIYDDSIRFGDALLQELQERLSEFDPVFIIHGDHGEAFDEHGIYGHFYPLLYEENVHVPLVVSGIEESATVERPFSLLDLPSVVERAAGLEDGSLAALGDDWVFATDYDGRFERNLTAVRTAGAKYIETVTRDDEPKREFFDLRDDRHEQRNLLPDREEAATPLRQLVERRTSHEAELLAIEKGVTDLAAESGL